MEWFNEAFGDFSEISLAALIIVVIAAVIGVIGLVYYRRNKKEGMPDSKMRWTVRELTMAALCIALAFLLSFIKLFGMPMGGSITPASMLPIMVFSYVYGWRKGLVVGLIYAVLQFVQEPIFLTPVQFLLDYILGFSVLGLAGVFQKSIIPGIALAGSLRFLCSFISGWVFFGMYAPEGMQAWLYSLMYNGAILGVETAVCVGICLIPAMRKAIDKARRERRNGQKKFKEPQPNTAV
ncbi:MAG: energy-coupled thiamine transporter ThiT [Christensenellaceae bacterium]|jgi:thiamine transporter